MSEHDNARAPLLSELEALQGLLEESPLPANIPVLDDILESSPRFAPGPGDAADKASNTPPVDDSDTPADNDSSVDWDENDHSRDVFLQELIDDLLPQIEAELRQRLLKLDSHILEQWYRQSRQP